MDWIIIIIIASGIFGGIVNFFLNDDIIAKLEVGQEKSVRFKIWYKILKSVFLGIAGSFTIPLFLRLTKTNMATFETYDFSQCLALIGFCLIASIFSKRFLVTISENVLKLVKEAKENSEIAKETSLEAKEEVNKVDAKIEKKNNEVVDTIDDKLALLEGVGKEPQRSDASLTLTQDEKALLPKKGLSVKGDQQKNQWGGLSERNNRRITAKVTESDYYEDYFKIVLKVESTDMNKPLTGYVIFHLHETFKNDERKVFVNDGIARLVLYAYGAFTVGVECDNGKTWLELDLAELEEAPKKFREN